MDLRELKAIEFAQISYPYNIPPTGFCNPNTVLLKTTCGSELRTFFGNLKKGPHCDTQSIILTRDNNTLEQSVCHQQIMDFVQRHLMAFAVWFLKHVQVEKVIDIIKPLQHAIQSKINMPMDPCSLPQLSCDSPVQQLQRTQTISLPSYPLLLADNSCVQPVQPSQSSKIICEITDTSESFGLNLEAVDHDYLIAHIVALLKSWTSNASSSVASIFDGATKVTTHMFVSALFDLLQHLECNDELFVVALCYIRRIQTSGWVVAEKNHLRLLLASMLLAMKYTEDRCIANSSFAHLCGLHGRDVNCMERRFLALIHYDLYITDTEFATMCHDIHTVAVPVFAAVA